MTPAVPDPTVEALSEAEVQLLREALGTMPGSYVNPVAEVVTRILAEHTERAVREARIEAWDEGWWKGQSDHDPTVLGYADNPYREGGRP